MIRCIDGTVLAPGKHYLVTIPKLFLDQDLFTKYHNQILRCEDIDLHDKCLVIEKTNISATWLRHVKTDMFNNRVLNQFATRFMAEVDAWESNGKKEETQEKTLEEHEADGKEEVFIVFLVSLIIVSVLMVTCLIPYLAKDLPTRATMETKFKK